MTFEVVTHNKELPTSMWIESDKHGGAYVMVSKGGAGFPVMQFNNCGTFSRPAIAPADAEVCQLETDGVGQILEMGASKKKKPKHYQQGPKMFAVKDFRVGNRREDEVLAVMNFMPEKKLWTPGDIAELLFDMKQSNPQMKRARQIVLSAMHGSALFKSHRIEGCPEKKWSKA